MDWMARIRKRDRLEVKRDRRLHRLMQKRAVLEREAELKGIFSHKKKRGKVNAMPHNHKGQANGSDNG